MKNILNKKVFLYTFLIWFYLNISGIQNIYFSAGQTLTIIIVKILHLFFLYAIFLKLNSLYNQRNIPKVKNEIIISIVYFLNFMNKFIDKEMSVLIETNKDGFSYGHTTNYLDIKIEGILEHAKIYNIKITGIDYPYCLGEIVEL